MEACLSLESQVLAGESFPLAELSFQAEPRDLPGLPHQCCRQAHQGHLPCPVCTTREQPARLAAWPAPHSTVHSGSGRTSSYGTLRWWEHLILRYTQVVGGPHPTIHSGHGRTPSYSTLRWWEPLILWYTQVAGAPHPTVRSGSGRTPSYATLW